MTTLLQHISRLVFVAFTFTVVSCASKTYLPAKRVSSDQIRVAFASCNDQTRSQQHWSQIATFDPDLLLLMGDNVYPSKQADLKSIREAYLILEASEEFRGIRQRAPIMATWDDHDYGLNDGGGDFALKKQSKSLFLDFFQEPRNSERRRRPGVYDSVIIGEPGKTLQVILLDMRSFRSPLLKAARPGLGKGPYRPTTEKQATMLGEAQWSWLEEELRKPADLRILVSSIQMFAEETGWETWSNFPNEKTRLLKLIAETKAENLIVVSGDRHHASLWRYRNTLTYPLFEAVSSSLNKPLPQKFRTPSMESTQLTPLEFAPNFGLIDINWKSKQVEILIVDSERADILLSRNIHFNELKFHR